MSLKETHFLLPNIKGPERAASFCSRQMFQETTAQCGHLGDVLSQELLLAALKIQNIKPLQIPLQRQSPEPFNAQKSVSIICRFKASVQLLKLPLSSSFQLTLSLR